MNPEISQIRSKRSSSTTASAVSAIHAVHENGPPTSQTLVGRLQCWEDTAAWKLFVNRYQHLFQSWSRRKLKNPADVDEVNQQVYWEIARRLPGFQYNPARSFRGWLKTLHQSRMLDFLKREKRRLRRESDASTARVPKCVQSPESSSRTSVEDGVLPISSSAAQQARKVIEIQQSVRARVSDRTWTVFHEIAIDGQSIAETAQRHSMKYASAFAAHSRVCQMLRLEAERREVKWTESDPATSNIGVSAER